MKANGTLTRGMRREMEQRVMVEKYLILQTLKKMKRRIGRMYSTCNVVLLVSPWV
jgi:hypothetical protein